MSLNTYQIIIGCVVGLMIVMVIYSFVRMAVYRSKGRMDKASNCLKAVILYVVAGIFSAVIGLIISHVIT